MKKVIVLNKKEGETPLECLESFRAKNKIGENIKMTYAGRLDPMASGVLLILIGEETKMKEKYLKLKKEYKFEILFGFFTDTYDVLGIPKVNNFFKSSDLQGPISWIPFKNYSPLEFGNVIQHNLKNFTGKFIQKYPMYSSKTVKGKPLFVYARNGKEVKIPERIVNVESFKFIRIRKINNKKLLENITKRIKKVKGDFRQKEILETWQKQLKVDGSFYIASFKIKCGSGTYVRCIANEFGKKIKIPSLAYSIKRTKVGNYMI